MDKCLATVEIVPVITFDRSNGARKKKPLITNTAQFAMELNANKTHKDISHFQTNLALYVHNFMRLNTPPNTPVTDLEKAQSKYYALRLAECAAKFEKLIDGKSKVNSAELTYFEREIKDTSFHVSMLSRI